MDDLDPVLATAGEDFDEIYSGLPAHGAGHAGGSPSAASRVRVVEVVPGPVPFAARREPASLDLNDHKVAPIERD